MKNKVIRPTGPTVRPEFIPDELKALSRWVCWRYQYSATKKKWEKKPVNSRTRRNTDITDIHEMSGFQQALACYQDPKQKLDGIGFALFANDPFSGIDLDQCRAAETALLEPWAEEIVRQMNTYTEVSPSGRGIRLFVRGKLAPGSSTRRNNIEVYSRGRFLTVTGIHLAGTPTTVQFRRDDLVRLHDRFLVKPAEVEGNPSTVAWATEPADEDVIARARQARNGDKFIRLYEQGDHSNHPSPSEADLALCGMLAYWLGDYATPQRVERLFGLSALGRSDKWVEREDYRQRTIQKAMKGSRDCRGQKMLIRTSQVNQDYSRKINTGSISSGDDMLPLSPEVEEAAVRAAQALAETEGTRPDWQVMFILARRLRRITDGKYSVPSFRRAVDAFCERAGCPAEEYWVAFLLCWRKALLAEGESPLDWAFKMAVERPIPTIPGYSLYCQRLASVAWYLSQLTGSRPFWLPVEQLASLLGVSAMTVSRVITLLEEDGIIKCVNENWSFKKHRAKEYLFRGGSAAEAA